jgi:chloramphenicol-sensitive protein RarD
LTAFLESQNVPGLSLPAVTFPRAQPRGVFAAILGYGAWGILPLYWKLFDTVSATELIAHRLWWSAVLLAAVVFALGRWVEVSTVFRSGPALRASALSGALLTANWFIFVWAVAHDRVIECSLGYFLVPLINALLGRLVLGERWRRGQVVALLFAALGVLVLIWQVGRVPWIALGLAGTFGWYGLARKRSALGPITGLAAETLLMAPLALGLLGFITITGVGALASGQPGVIAGVISTGLVTTVPLVFFAYGARKLRLTTLGLLQYLAPTLQFLLGWLLFHEPFTRAQAFAFLCIWVGLAVYSTDAWRASRRPLTDRV